MNKKVMIVDDDEELHILYGLYLRGASYQLLEAYNGKQAFELLEKERPGVIVLDMIMPEMDGETFLRQMHGMDGLNTIPVIIASVNEKISPELTGYANVKAILRKPFTIQVLTDAIKKILAS